MDTASLTRPLLISGMLSGIVLVSAWYYDPLTYAPLCLLAMLWQVLRALYYALRRSWAALRLCGIRLLIWGAVMVCLIAVHNHYLKATQQSADTLVAALQTYRARESRYPRELDALAPRDIAVVPLAVRAPSHVAPFRYRISGNTGDQFTLTFVSGFRYQHIYDSTMAKWEVRD